MAQADGSVVIEILGDDKDINDKLKGVASGAVQGLKRAFSAVTAGVAAASSAVGILAKQSLDAYGSYEQLTGGVETLFKDSADAVMQYADNAYKTAGISANSYMETVTSFSASLIQALGGDTQKAAEMSNLAITDMADNANKMGTPMEEIQRAYQSMARGNFAMLDSLKLGYGGTKAEMERLLADAEKLSGVHYEMGNFADLIDAVHVVQTELGITGTTAAEASGTIQGSAGAASAAWQNLITGIGDENADLGGLIDNFVSSAETAAANILPRITQILGGMGQVIQELSPVLAAEIPNLISSILPSLVIAGGQLLAGITSGIVQALPGLASASAQIIETLTTGLSDVLPQLIPVGVEAILQLVGTLTAPDSLSNLIEASLKIILALAEGISNALPKLTEQATIIIANLAVAIIKNLPKILLAGMTLIEVFCQGISQSLGAFLTVAVDIITAIVDGLAKFASPIVEAGKDIIRGLWQGISDMAGWIAEKIQGFGEGVLDALKDFFGIASPSRVMRDEVGKMLGEGFAEGIDDSTKTAVKSAETMSKDVQDALSGNALDGVDITALSNRLKAAVEAESANLSARLTVSSNAPAEARAARDRGYAAQAAAANYAYNGKNEGTFVLNIDGKEFYRGTLDSLRTVEDERPRTLDDT